VGGRLRHYWNRWLSRGADNWVVGVLRWGYQIPLSQQPQLTKHPLFLSHYQDPQMNCLLEQSIRELLAKGAIERVHTPASPGFYSRLFLRPKASGGWRPILDLSFLNPYVAGSKKKQETQHQIRSSLRQHHWTISVDLTDAFFHIPIHHDSRHLLRFGYQDQIYQYTALPFGLKTAPWVFTTVVSQIQCMPETAHIPIHFYLDDWLTQVESVRTGIERSQTITNLCDTLGLLVNYKKSDLIPSQVFTYLGARYNLATYLVCPTQENFQKIIDLGTKFLQNKALPARTWLQLIGLLNSQEKLTTYGRRRLRHVQWALRAQWRSALRPLTHMVSVTREAITAIQWWMDPNTVLQGTPIRLPDPTLEVQTDASVTGWGGHSGTQVFSGTWSGIEQELHINLLEMRAVRLTLEQLRPHRDQHILVHTDNVTVMTHLNKQGGVRSWEMFRETEQVLQMAEENHWFLSAKHVPGRLNILADQLSRRSEIISTEWELHQEAAQLLFQRWGTPNIDLFATKLNKKLAIYVSPVMDPEAWDTEALSISWEGLSAYAFPPHPILAQVLEKVDGCRRLRLILVAPMWK